MRDQTKWLDAIISFHIGEDFRKIWPWPWQAAGSSSSSNSSSLHWYLPLFKWNYMYRKRGTYGIQPLSANSPCHRFRCLPLSSTLQNLGNQTKELKTWPKTNSKHIDIYIYRIPCIHHTHASLLPTNL